MSTGGDNEVHYETSVTDGSDTIRRSRLLKSWAVNQEKEIGSCEARFIDRDAFDYEAPLHFWDRIHGQAPVPEARRLAFDLFDHKGEFRKKFYQDGPAKGKGYWGRDLRRGNIVLLENFYVELDWRRKRVGTKIFENLLKVAATRDAKKGAGEDYFVFTRAGALQGTSAKQRNIKQDFFRFLGFRRVGNTEWFAYAPDPEHSSRKSRAEDDLRIPRQQIPALREDQAELFSKVSNPQTSDKDCVKEIRESISRQDPTYWLAAKAEDGDTLLHRAAKAFKPDTLSYIISKMPGLVSEPNARGYTPLQALEEEMDKLRFPFTGGDVQNAMVVPKSDPKAALECQKRLRSS